MVTYTKHKNMPTQMLQKQFSPRTISVIVPAGILSGRWSDASDFAQELKRRAALDMYKQGELSLGQSAALADMNKEQFLGYLAFHKISPFLFDDDELREEMSDI